MIFIREIVGLFRGSEFTLGFLLSSWLFWTGAGGLAGGRAARKAKIQGGPLLRGSAFVSAALLPLTVLTIRAGRGWLADPPGELPGFGSAVLFSFLVLAPFGLVYGTMYNTASSLSFEGDDDVRGGIRRVYVLESAGALAGAMVFSLFLIRYLSQFEAASAVALGQIALSVVPAANTRRTVISVVSAAAICAVSVPFARTVDRWSIEKVFPRYRVEAFTSSKHGEIVRVEEEGTLSFFSGGGRLFSIPEPERSEEAVHLPLLAHPGPKRVLMIGGSLGGGREEALKHGGITSLECVELDEELIRLAGAREGRSRLREKPGAPEKEDGTGMPVDVTLAAADGRYLLRTGDGMYDVIIVSVPSPLTLQWNRFYTREFFEIASSSLAEGGLLALSHPSSENFISAEQAIVLGDIRSTLLSVFDDVTVLPGATAHFMAGRADISPGKIMERLDERDLDTRYVTADLLPARLEGGRMSFIEESLEENGGRINTDWHPSLPYYELVLETRRTGTGARRVLVFLEGLHGAAVPVSLGIVLVLLVLLSRGGMRARIAVFITGFCAFLFQIVLLLALQSYSGMLYESIVLMTSLFMAGAAAGAAMKVGGALNAARKTGLLHLVFMILIVLFIPAAGALKMSGTGYTAGTAIFGLFSLAGGLITGMYYRNVVDSAFPVRGRDVPAVFYSWDLFGACLGGTLGGSLLLPLAGISATLMLLLVLHLAAGAVFSRRFP